MSSPNIMTNQQPKTIPQTSGGLKRTHSAPINIQKTNNPATTPPKANVQQRDRRMSEPFTSQEKVIAKEDHMNKRVYNSGQNEVKQTIQDPNMEKYDQIGMYPSVRRLVAMGDLHGDLRITLIALRLAKVIPQNIFPYNVNQISWCGGDTWVIQLGDQIDRCRPDN